MGFNHILIVDNVILLLRLLLILLFMQLVIVVLQLLLILDQWAMVEVDVVMVRHVVQLGFVLGLFVYDGAALGVKL